MLFNPLKRAVRVREGFPVLPGSWPLLGHLPAIVLRFPHLLEQARRDLGDFFWIDFGFTAAGPELMCLHADAFSLFQNKQTSSEVLGEVAAEPLKHTMVSEDGPSHRSIRSPMNATFQPKGLSSAGIGALFADMIASRVASWQARPDVPILRETRQLVLALMFRMLGVDEHELGVWEKNYERFFQLVIAPPIDLPGMPRPRGRRARDWIDDRLRSMIDEARARGAEGGLLSVLMRSIDDEGEQISETRLLSNLRFLVLAGHETTAATMANIVVELARRPEVWSRLCDEAAAFGRVPRTPDDLAYFPYAEALFRETLRCRPVLAVTRRRTLTPVQIGDVSVPAHTTMAIPILHLSRHPDLYERPDEFLLERWLGRSEGTKPFERLQFGGGPHFCLGYHLAWLEIVQFCAALALTLGTRRLRPRLLDDRDGRIQRYYPTAVLPSRARVTFA